MNRERNAETNNTPLRSHSNRKPRKNIKASRPSAQAAHCPPGGAPSQRSSAFNTGKTSMHRRRPEAPNTRARIGARTVKGLPALAS
jgi:hypothetical protein